MAGFAAAKAQGRTGGRPTVTDADKLAAARDGGNPAKIAKALGVSRASIHRHVVAEGE
jgi:DNA invertase Pin-like site-specific DNA recombinase